MFTSLFQLEKKAVTVYRSSDADAPILTADPGSLKTLLKACLVTGYGNKDSLGWQMKFESDDALSAVFVSNDATSGQCCFKIDNSATDNAKLSAYQQMTDIDTGIRPLVVDNLYKNVGCNWTLIGHSKLFVLLLDLELYAGQNKVSMPILFGDMPRQVKRTESLTVIWSGRVYASKSGGVQSTLFYKENSNGVDDTSSYTGINRAICYPFVVNNGQDSYNLQQNYCRFSYDSHVQAPALHEPIFCALPDGTWTFIPCFEPLSTVLSDVSNLGDINSTTLKTNTGRYYNDSENLDCAVKTDWWYA